jgi:excisionase family DNA binding protein
VEWYDLDNWQKYQFVFGMRPDASARRTITRMKAATLEEAQSHIRLETKSKPKGEVAAEHFVTPPIASDLLNVKEAAAYLRVSVSQLYSLTRHRGVARAQHPIPVIRLGVKSLRFRRSSLEKWLAELKRAAG